MFNGSLGITFGKFVQMKTFPTQMHRIEHILHFLFQSTLHLGTHFND
jgi:hypothetical protein